VADLQVTQRGIAEGLGIGLRRSTTTQVVLLYLHTSYTSRVMCINATFSLLQHQAERRTRLNEAPGWTKHQAENCNIYIILLRSHNMSYDIVP
jgi:hypothetical protein